MKQERPLPQVGVPDPEMKTSPIYIRDAVETPDPDFELEEGVCYFNGLAYARGDYVLSGEDLLRCEDPGIWVQKREDVDL